MRSLTCCFLASSPTLSSVRNRSHATCCAHAKEDPCCCEFSCHGTLATFAYPNTLCQCSRCRQRKQKCHPRDGMACLFCDLSGQAENCCFVRVSRAIVTLGRNKRKETHTPFSRSTHILSTSTCRPTLLPSTLSLTSSLIKNSPFPWLRLHNPSRLYHRASCSPRPTNSRTANCRQ